jgi:hypothetical protein
VAGNFALKDVAATTSEDAVVALGGAAVLVPPKLDFRHSLAAF